MSALKRCCHRRFWRAVHCHMRNCRELEQADFDDGRFLRVLQQTPISSVRLFNRRSQGRICRALAAFAERSLREIS